MALLIATGNLGMDAELKNSRTGTPFLKFSIGDSKSRKLDDGTWEETASQWLECSIWGGQAEVFADLRKGDRVEITGEFYARTYEHNGADRTSLDVKVHGVKVLKRKDGGNSPQQARGGSQGGFSGQQSSGGFGGAQGGAQDFGGFGQDDSAPF